MKKTSYISLLDSFGSLYTSQRHGKFSEDMSAVNNVTRKSWQFDLVNKFNIDPDTIVPLSQNGLCLEYISHALDYLINKNLTMCQESLIITAVPDPNRLWWCSDASYSHVHNLAFPEVRKSILKYTKLAGEDYVDIEFKMKSVYQYGVTSGCYPPELAKQKAKHFISYIHYLRSKYDLEIVVLPISTTEDDIGIQYNKFKTIGTLQEIQAREMESDELNLELQQLDGEWKGRDTRINHMVLDNHKILAKKIYQSITTNKDLDLLEGFKTKVITKDNAKTFKDLNLTHPSLKDEQFYDIIKGPSFHAD